ncbi:MAG TPA: hypothetical protein VE988_27480, partial [Gemmataceae bacterium]|nr:hypothetical protein [Gemmataceae bacterium]
VAIQQQGGVTDPGGSARPVQPTATTTLGILGDPKPNPTLLPGVIKPRSALPAAPGQQSRPSLRRRIMRLQRRRTPIRFTS